MRALAVKLKPRRPIAVTAARVAIQQNDPLPHEVVAPILDYVSALEAEADRLREALRVANEKPASPRS